MFGRVGRRDYGRLGAAEDQPGWAFPFTGATWDLDFVNRRYFGKAPTDLTVTRASLATDLLPSSPSATTFTSFANDTARIISGGLLIEGTQTNSLTNSTAPVTQTCTLATGTFVLWVNGTGSCAPTLGTALGTAAGSATVNAFNTITITTSGTVVFTVTGSLNAFQCERMSGTIASPTSLIQTSAVAAARAVETVSLAGVPTITSMSLYVSATPLAATAFAANLSFASLSDGTANNRISAFRATGTAVTDAVSVTGGVSSSMNTAIVASSGVGIKMAIASNSGLSVFAVNAQKAIGAAPTAPPVSVTTVQMGMNGAGAGALNGLVQRVAIFGTALSSGQLMRITSGPLP